MMILEIAGCILCLFFLALFLPITYRISFAAWKLEIRISALGGLLSKKKFFSFHKEKTMKEEEEKKEEESISSESAREELNRVLDEWEDNQASEEKDEEDKKAAEVKRQETAEEEEKLPSADDSGKAPLKKEKAHPSYAAQLCFALDNGLAERCLKGALRIAAHGFPGRYHIEGELGLGEPMHTGILCGLVYTFFLKAAEDIQWNYVDRVCTLSGRAGGRLIPLYLLYILLTLALSKPAREFWHFRQGGNDNG